MASGVTSDSSVSAQGGGRYPELDSLRGIASLIVVLSHFWLFWFAWTRNLAGPWIGGHPLDALYPLHAGHEAVMLFFVLSGLVLTLPYLRGKVQPYRHFLLRRIARIYGPYVVALAICILCAAHWHSNTRWPGTWRGTFWNEPVHLSLILKHLLFLGVYNWQQYDFVIWSLIYEMRISILFPALAFVILKLRARTAVLTAVLCSLVSLAIINKQDEYDVRYDVGRTLHYIAFFILGIAIAKNLKRIEMWYGSLPVAMRFALALGSLAFYNLGFRFGYHGGSTPWLILGEWLAAIGAVGLIVGGLNSRYVSRGLSSPAPRFLGRISYSLYLVHPPVLLIAGILLDERLAPGFILPIYVGVSIAAAYVFCLALEEPFIRLGRRVGRRSVRSASQAAQALEASRVA